MSDVTITVNVFNHTNADMMLEDTRLEQGEWISKPGRIGKGKEGSFKAGNGKSHCVNVQVIWRGKRNRNHFTITIDKPVDGTTRFDVDCPDSFRYAISGDPLEQHAVVSVSFYNQDLKSTEAAPQQ